MAFCVKDVLRLQVAPALGCTEPVAVALAAAAAASLLPGGRQAAEAVEVWTDPNVYKNGLAVSIPGTAGLSGLDTAAALGVAGGDASLRLEVLDPVGPEHVEAAKAMLREGRAQVHLLADRRGLHIRALVRGGGHEAEAVIEGQHDRIVSLRLDGADVGASPLLASGAAAGGGQMAELEDWLRGLSLAELIAMTDELDPEDLAFLRQGVDYNLRSEERRVGKECRRLCRSRWSPYH
jgi:L-cysteine desulfidase